jgi:hypothetical protein
LIYLDTSAALAQLLSEDRRPPQSLWSEPLVSSRLLEYEIWTRLHGAGLAKSHGEMAHLLIERVAMLEMVGPVLARALEPFPIQVRTLDALHLASVEFLRSQGVAVRLASYDERQLKVADRLGISIQPL